MFEPKYCKKCGSKLKIKNTKVGFDESTGKPVNVELRYCPMVLDDTIFKAYLNGTLCLGRYYHGHYLQENDEA